jgi:uncharacterized membrane protein YebE (DUF533 family)
MYQRIRPFNTSRPMTALPTWLIRPGGILQATMILPGNKSRDMESKKKKTGKAAAAGGMGNKKGRHTSTQATGPKRQAIEPAAGRGGGQTTETDNAVGMQQD